MAMLKSLRDLFIHSLQEIFDAEKQLLDALPKMVQAASSEKLQAAFSEHLQQTVGHVERLEAIFKSLEVSGHGGSCAAMKGLIEGGTQAIDQDADAALHDAALIAAAQKVEHFEIASYGTAATFAELLNASEAAELLKETLEEEKDTDQKLTQLALSEINVEARMAPVSPG